MTTTHDPRVSPSTARLDAALEACPLLAIIRAREGRSDLAEIVGAFVDAGFRAVEITVDSPGWQGAVEAHASRDDVVMGAGTVHTAADLDAIVAAGGQFAVSPHLDPRLVRAAIERGLVPVPGVFTPTEVNHAMAAGATHVKLFPSVSAGPRHLRALREPMPEVRVVPTGGVGIDDIGPWLDAGAHAVGLGGSLLADSISEIAVPAREAVDAAMRWRARQAAGA